MYGVLYKGYKNELSELMCIDVSDHMFKENRKNNKLKCVIGKIDAFSVDF